jgi:fluoride exporter
MLGSALGGMARYGLSGAVAGRVGAAFPWGTLLVNVSGCLAIGLFFGVSGTGPLFQAAPAWHQLLTYGFLGGYTTFSTFSLEALNLARGGRLWRAGVYVAGSFAVCLAGVTLGLLLASAL